MGKLYDLIQQYIDRQQFPPSERKVAQHLGVTQTTLSNWRTPRKLVDKVHLEAIADLTGVPYERVLDALLEDIDYKNRSRPDFVWSEDAVSLQDAARKGEITGE